jgi:hypothetical protein
MLAAHADHITAPLAGVQQQLESQARPRADRMMLAEACNLSLAPRQEAIALRWRRDLDRGGRRIFCETSRSHCGLLAYGVEIGMLADDLGDRLHRADDIGFFERAQAASHAATNTTQKSCGPATLAG